MEPLEPDDPEMLGPYRLMARLGAGGMGRVFLARSPNGSTVAVKMVRAELAADREFRDRFRREVAAAQAVSGPCTAPVAGADPDAAVPWLATTYVLGRPLDGAVAEFGPLPARSLQGLGAGLAEALGVIHAAGLAHRDLKPSNVLLAADGPRVIDFGIARAVGHDRMTTTGAVIGSPGYMSPEQASGQDAGPAGDVFCLASVMMHAATGRGPFEGGSPAALLYQVVYAEPDLTRLPPGLARILRPCFAKDPGARPTPRQIAAAFAPDGAAAVLGDGWLPASLAGSIARHAATVLQMDTPSQATRLDRAAAWPPGSPTASGRHRRTSEDRTALATAPSDLARRRILLGSAAVAVVAAAGGGVAYAVAAGSDKKPGTGTAAGSLARVTTSSRPSLPPGVAPEPLWRVPVSAPVTSAAPTVAGNLVLVKTDSGSQGTFSATMTALDLTTGKQRWAFPGINNNEQAAPVVAGGVAVTLDSNSSLITLSLAKGEATTTTTAPGKAQFLDVLAATPTTAYIFGVADNTARTDTYVLWAIDLRTGKVRWSQSDGNKRINIGTTLTVAGSKLLCTDSLYNVTARNPATGVVLWNVNVGRLKDFVDPQPFLAASPRPGIAITAREELTGRDLVTGAMKWLVPAIAARNFFTKPVMSADGTICYVVVESNPGAVLAIDAANGDKKWDISFDFPGQNPPVLVGGLLFASIAPGGTTGMYAFDGASGKNLWSFTDATSTGDEWMLAGVPSSGTVVALHDSALLALPAAS